MRSSIPADTASLVQREADAPAIVPPLQEGDRLSRAEFERRYHAMPHLNKAELIEGVVHMPSPVRIKQHAGPHGDVLAFLGTYKAHSPGTGCGGNATVRLDMENEPQPDGVLFIEPEFGGRVRIDPDDYLNGSPEWAGEIAASTSSIDLGKKFQAYRRNEILEYVVWRVLDRAIDWFFLKDGDYQRLEPTAGIFKSTVFPGLWLEVEALLGNDMRRVLEVLHQGLASPEHQDFVAKLQKKQA